MLRISEGSVNPGGEGRVERMWGGGHREDSVQKRGEGVSLFLFAVKKRRSREVTILSSLPVESNPRTKMDPALPRADSTAHRETFGSPD